MENFKEEPTITWESVLERYQGKVEKIRADMSESDERNEVLNIIDQDMPVLFKTYKEKNYSLKQVQDDLQHKMESIEDKDSSEYLSYRTIWEMTDGRNVSL